MSTHDWSTDVFEALKQREITTVATIPDGGLTKVPADVRGG